jgi:hypothetical protein
MLLFLALVVVLLAVLVFGGLQQVREREAALASSSKELRSLQEELADTRRRLGQAAALGTERERELKDGEHGLDLLSKIVIWHDPWARTGRGSELMCFYCGAVESADHSVEHDKACRFVESHDLLRRIDAARGQ